MKLSNSVIPVKTALGAYNVNVCRGGINKISEYVARVKELGMNLGKVIGKQDRKGIN